MNIQVDPTRSNLASAMLNSKIRPRAVVGYGIKILLPSPPSYVTRSPGNIASDNMPAMISDLVVWSNSPYNLRGHYKAVVPRFSTYFMKNSVCYRGAALWNCVSEYFYDSCNFKQFYSKAKSSPMFRENKSKLISYVSFIFQKVIR